MILLQIYNQNLGQNMAFQPKTCFGQKPKMEIAKTLKLKHISAETEPKLFRFAHYLKALLLSGFN